MTWEIYSPPPNTAEQEPELRTQLAPLGRDCWFLKGLMGLRIWTHIWRHLPGLLRIQKMITG